METRLIVTGVVAGVGLILLVVGCVLIPVFDDVVYDTVVEAARYENGTDGYDNFINSSSPTYTYFYFFNLTNADEFMNNASAKPILEEVGPYVYRTTKPKEDLHFLEGGTKLSYKTRTTYYYDWSRSNPNLNPYTDEITNVNYVILTAAKLLDRIWLPMVRWNFKQAIREYGDTIFETYTVNDYLWGYFDETLNASGLIPAFIDSPMQGIFYGNNGSLGDEYVVYTGTNDIDLVNELDTWKGYNVATFEDLLGITRPPYKSYFANMLNGTDGTQYKPFIEKDDTIYTFTGDLCRSFTMKLDSEVDIEGINAYRYVLDPANMEINEENEAFCVPRPDNCLPHGLMNVERCYDLAPMVASLPHFLDVDPEIQDTIIGLNPVKSVHETAIDVEPITGIAVQGNKRLQISAWIKQYRLFPDTMNNEKFAGDGFIFPMFWLNESSRITPPDAEDFISEVIDPINLLEIIQYLVIGVGAFIMLVGLVVFTFFKCSQSRKSWA